MARPVTFASKRILIPSNNKVTVSAAEDAPRLSPV